MKKVISTTGLKAIPTLCFLLITVFTSNAQQGDWELGVGLRPLNLKDEPYAIILKKHLSPRVGLRFGMSGMYRSRSEHFGYDHLYNDTIHSFSYKYNLMNKDLYVSTSMGIQYRFGKKNPNARFIWYGTSDFYFKYRLEKPDLGRIYFTSTILRPGDFFIAADFNQRKSIITGVRQGVGIQYFLDNFLSVSLEGGFFYEASFSKETQFVYAQSSEGYHVLRSALRNYKDFQLGFSPIMLLSFNYHF